MVELLIIVGIFLLLGAGLKGAYGFDIGPWN
jgi:hypothetical protein